jgi:hypothetical protein
MFSQSWREALFKDVPCAGSLQISFSGAASWLLEPLIPIHALKTKAVQHTIIHMVIFPALISVCLIYMTKILGKSYRKG